jgi:hypothetical protein
VITLDHTPQRQARRHPVWHVLRIGGLVAGLGFLVWVFATLLRDPGVAFDRVRLKGFVAALVVGIAANAVVGALFATLIEKLAPEIPARRRFGSYYWSQLAKYVPGRIAAILVQSATLDVPGAVAISVITNVELIAVTTGLCALAAFSCLAAQSSYALAVAIAVAGVVAGAWAIRLDWMPLMRKAARMFRFTVPARTREETRPPFARAMALAAGSLVLPASSMYVLLAAGFGFDANHALSLTAALLLSWVGGMLAVVFPAGIGIRELLFMGAVATLTQAATAEQLAAIALMSRLIQVLTDLSGTGLFAVLDLATKQSADMKR